MFIVKAEKCKFPSNTFCFLLLLGSPLVWVVQKCQMIFAFRLTLLEKLFCDGLVSISSYNKKCFSSCWSEATSMEMLRFGDFSVVEQAKVATAFICSFICSYKFELLASINRLMQLINGFGCLTI